MMKDHMHPSVRPSRSALIGGFAKFWKTWTATFAWVKVVRNLIGFVIISAILWWVFQQGVPWYFIFPFWLLILALIIIGIPQAWSATRADIGPSATYPSKERGERITIGPDEKVTLRIPGILRVGWGLYNIGLFSLVRQNRYPENTILLTDKHLLFVYVPLPGGEKTIGSLDVGTWHFLLASKDIASALDEQLKIRTLDGLFRSYPGNFGISLESVRYVRCDDSKRSVFVKTKGDQTFSYGIRAAEDYQNAKQAFAKFGA